MADNSKLDALMMLMALEAMKSGMTDKTVTPFSVSIQVSATSISCHSEGNKKLIEDIGAQEWLKETQDRIGPIMAEQTTKFAELMGKKFGFSFSEPHKSETRIDDFLSKLFGGVLRVRRSA